ncbi:MAG: TRAP-type C4-dicarboxylate transport system permease small subunit [Paracoccaceae bacterium]|jgi:TRAP-type C4-dicarboxylate transport system permease small subunit
MNDWQDFLGLPLWFWLFVLPTGFIVLCGFMGERMQMYLEPIWQVLNRLYLASGVVAACFMVMILLLIVAQMITRWSGIAFPGSTDFAGYAMAATSFFALAYALNKGAHIRVSIFLNMNTFTKTWMDAFAMLIAAVTATYFARYAVKTNFFSEMLNDRTQGMDQVPEWVLTPFGMLKTAPSQWGELWANTGSDWVFTPIWLPQLPMSIGTTLLAIALWDNLSRLLVNGQSNIVGEAVE